MRYRTLQDNMSATWAPEDIANEVLPYIVRYDIDTVRFGGLLSYPALNFV